jgi:hypothetical protein
MDTIFSSLNKRDEVRFRQSKLEIEEMRAQAEGSEITLAYVDKTGFALAHPNLSDWTPVGKCHKIHANRGKRLNDIGAMLSTGDLFSVAIWQTTNSQLFTGFLGLLVNYVAKPLTIILDNASFQKREISATAVEGAGSKGTEALFLSALQTRTQSN